MNAGDIVLQGDGNGTKIRAVFPVPACSFDARFR
jgi:hypothetical protein